MRGSARRGSLLVITRRDDPGVIGLLDYRLGEPEPGRLAIGFIAVAKGYRGWGYGSEAVRLLEAEAARRWGAQGFRAGADMRNGLALYFWLRLGYRPGEAAPDSPAREAMPMVRTIP